MFPNNPSLNAAEAVLHDAISRVQAHCPDHIGWAVEQGVREAFASLNKAGAHISAEAILERYPRFQVVVPRQQEIIDAFTDLGGTYNLPQALALRLEAAGFQPRSISHAINAAISAGILVQIENGHLRKA